MDPDKRSSGVCFFQAAAFCSSTITSSTAEGLSERSGEMFNCVIPSISTAAILKPMNVLLCLWNTHSWGNLCQKYMGPLNHCRWGIFSTPSQSNSHQLPTKSTFETPLSSPQSKQVLPPHVPVASEYSEQQCQLKFWIFVVLMYQVITSTQSNRPNFHWSLPG